MQISKLIKDNKSVVGEEEEEEVIIIEEDSEEEDDGNNENENKAIEVKAEMVERSRDTENVFDIGRQSPLASPFGQGGVAARKRK